jgi:hypothetical protein
MKVHLFCNLLLYTILFISVNITFSQEFSGKITYAFSYEAKDKSVPVENLMVDTPTDSVVYTIKNGHYKSERYFEGKLIEYYTYSSSNKKMYYTTEDRSYFIYFDPHHQKYASKVYSEVHEGKDEILGYPTYKSTDVVAGSEHLNFYSKEVYVDPASFEGHLFGAWHELLKINNGAIPLRTVTNNYDHYEIKSAIKITQLELSEKDFELNENTEIVASRESLEILAEANEPDQATYFCYLAKVEEIAGKMIEGKNYNYVLRMVIDENGNPTHIKAINSDYLGFEKVAEQIIKECGFKFTPGKIDDQFQKAEIFMPIGF